MAKNKTKTKKLTLKRETIRALTPADLSQVAGGYSGTCHTTTLER